jgi:cytochrome-b5 reductase
MSFLRFATRTPRVQARYFGTSSGCPAKSSNLPLYLSGAGLVGLTAYFYFGGSPTPFSPVASPPTKPKQEKSALDAERFLDLKLKAVVPYNHNTARFIFELPNGGAALSPVTSLVVVRASEGAAAPPVDKKGNLAVRAYTPISSPEHEGELVLLIKKYENGAISKYVHEQLKPGDTLSIKGPISKFPYKGTRVPSRPRFAHSSIAMSHGDGNRIAANEFEDVALIGGGSGITPLYQLLNHALNDTANRTRFTLLFANVTEADILLREELAALERAHPNTFRIVHTLDNPSAGWSGASGHVSRELIKAHIPPAERGDKIKVLICGALSIRAFPLCSLRGSCINADSEFWWYVRIGPPGQVNAVAGKKDGPRQGAVGGILKELGYTEDQVFKF